MDYLQLSRLYSGASHEAYQVHKFKDEAALAETEEQRETAMMWHDASMDKLERIELKIQALKLTIPVA